MDRKTKDRVQTFAAIAGACVLAIVIQQAPDGFGIGVSIISLFIILPILLGLIPILIASQRKHHQIGLITLLSFLGLVPVIGWVTWILALVMAAATSPVPAYRAELPPLRPLGELRSGRDSAA